MAFPFLPFLQSDDLGGGGVRVALELLYTKAFSFHGLCSVYISYVWYNDLTYQDIQLTIDKIHDTCHLSLSIKNTPSTCLSLLVSSVNITNTMSACSDIWNWFLLSVSLLTQKASFFFFFYICGSLLANLNSFLYVCFSQSSICKHKYVLT